MQVAYCQVKSSTFHIFNLTLTRCTGQTVPKQLAHKPVTKKKINCQFIAIFELL